MTSSTAARRPAARRQDAPVQPVPDLPAEPAEPAAPLEWEDPPAGGSRSTNDKYAVQVAAMRANPGKWLVVARIANPDMSSSGNGQGIYRLAKSIRRGSLSFGPAGTFEAEARKSDGVLKCYARYAGEPAATGAAQAGEPVSA